MFEKEFPNRKIGLFSKGSIVNVVLSHVLLGTVNRELWQATRTSPNKRFNEQGRVVRKPVNVNPGLNVN